MLLTNNWRKRRGADSIHGAAGSTGFPTERRDTAAGHVGILNDSIMASTVFRFHQLPDRQKWTDTIVKQKEEGRAAFFFLVRPEGFCVLGCGLLAPRAARALAFAARPRKTPTLRRFFCVVTPCSATSPYALPLFPDAARAGLKRKLRATGFSVFPLHAIEPIKRGVDGGFR